MATSARDAVLSTVELVENIMVHLDNKTLLLSQRVSKSWSATIAKSNAIQIKLFFKLAKIPSTRTRMLQVHNLNFLKPLAIKFVSCIDQRMKHDSNLADHFASLPFNISVEPMSYNGASRLFLALAEVVIAHKLPKRLTLEPTGSWKRMYLLRAGFGIRYISVYTTETEAGVLKKARDSGTLLEAGPYEGLTVSELLELVSGALQERTKDGGAAF